jgi:hypothetical protein
MRGADSLQRERCLAPIRLEDFVPASHPLRPIRKWVNEALVEDGREVLGHVRGGHSSGGRPSIAPEKLMRAMLLQVLFSVRSERQLVEQIHYNLLFRWFVGLSIEDSSVEPLGVQQEPRPADRARGGDRVVQRDGGDGRASEACSRASTSAWTARSSRPGPATRACGARTDPTTDRSARRLARRAAQQRHARVARADRLTRGCTARATRRPALPELPGPRAHRQPARPGGQRAVPARLGRNVAEREAACADAEPRSQAQQDASASHGGRRQGLRHQGASSRRAAT